MAISVALAGSGGAGVITAGRLLLDAAAGAGWFGCMTRSTGAQIRGGESAALLRLDRAPVTSHDDRFEVLLALDWRNVDRFTAEIPLDRESLLLGDAGAGDAPEALLAGGPRRLDLPFTELARSVSGGRPNMVALGALACIVGLPEEACDPVLGRALAGKGATALEAGAACVRAGHTAARTYGLSGAAVAVGEGPDRHQVRRWFLTGNEACGVGAVRAGVRFVAAYPITPATEVLEWLAPALGRLGGALVQAEDELASINQCIGASFGGVPALTATSGPGLALMTESLGLAVASETPVVVVDVMRCGPSTGIPTKSEQSDLNIALHGLHGDAPHLVLAPNGIADCAHTTQWAVYLAEALQTAAIVLSDQSLGQTLAVLEAPADPGLDAQRRLPAIGGTPGAAGYRRYAPSQDGVSPMGLPGMPGYQHTADGLSHNATGTPSSQAADHVAQLEKRRTKLEHYDFGERWADVEGDGDDAVITWGASTGPVREALARLALAGRRIRCVSLRLLAPAQPARLAAALAGVQRVVVVEQSAGAQLYRYLRGYFELPPGVRSLALPGPLPIRPDEVARAIEGWAELPR